MRKKTYHKQDFKNNATECNQQNHCVFAELIRQKKEKLAQRKAQLAETSRLVV